MCNIYNFFFVTTPTLIVVPVDEKHTHLERVSNQADHFLRIEKGQCESCLRTAS